MVKLRLASNHFPKKMEMAYFKSLHAKTDSNTAYILKWVSFSNPSNRAYVNTTYNLEKKILSGRFAYIGNSFKATLEGPLLPWNPFHQSVGLCLRFNYLMPTQSKSSLKVFLRGPKQKEPVLVWQLVGNHGEKWSAAQVAWSGAKGIQVKRVTHW